MVKRTTESFEAGPRHECACVQRGNGAASPSSLFPVYILLSDSQTLRLSGDGGEGSIRDGVSEGNGMEGFTQAATPFPDEELRAISSSTVESILK